MPYGTIKVDTITFTSGSSDVSIPISGLVQNPTFTGNVTVTGTVSGTVVRGNTVSGATVTGTAGQFDTLTGNTAGFTTVTGTTITGNFVQATSVTGVSGVFTTRVSGATVTGNAIVGSTITGVSGVFTTVISGASGIIAGNITASAFIPTGSAVPTNGVYLPSANTVGIAANSSGILFATSTGVGIGTNTLAANLHLQHAAQTSGVWENKGFLIQDDSTANTGLALYSRSSAEHYIASLVDSSSSFLIFGTRKSSTVSGIDALTIRGDGKVNIGVTAVNAAYSPTPQVFISGGATPLILSNGDNTGTFLQFNTGAASGVVELQADARTGPYPSMTFKTGGNTRMTIDKDGRIPRVAQPAFTARSLSNAATDGYVSTIPAYLKFATVDTNIGGHYDSSTGRFTAPIAGIYFFFMAILVDNSATAGSITSTTFYKNETTPYTIAYNENAGGDYNHMTNCLFIELAVNDYISVRGNSGFIHIGSETAFGGFLV